MYTVSVPVVPNVFYYWRAQSSFSSFEDNALFYRYIFIINCVWPLIHVLLSSKMSVWCWQGKIFLLLLHNILWPYYSSMKKLESHKKPSCSVVAMSYCLDFQGKSLHCGFKWDKLSMWIEKWEWQRPILREQRHNPHSLPWTFVYNQPRPLFLATTANAEKTSNFFHCCVCYSVLLIKFIQWKNVGT